MSILTIENSSIYNYHDDSTLCPIHYSGLWRDSAHKFSGFSAEAKPTSSVPFLEPQFLTSSPNLSVVLFCLQRGRFSFTHSTKGSSGNHNLTVLSNFTKSYHFFVMIKSSFLSLLSESTHNSNRFLFGIPKYSL